MAERPPATSPPAVGDTSRGPERVRTDQLSRSPGPGTGRASRWRSTTLSELGKRESASEQGPAAIKSPRGEAGGRNIAHPISPYYMFDVPMSSI